MAFWKPPAQLKKPSKPLMPIVPKRTVPKSFSGERSSDDPPPFVNYEYKPPSLFEEHKLLAIVFGALLLGLSFYCYFAVYKPLTYPEPPQPVYVESVTPPSPATGPPAPPTRTP